MNPSEQSYSQPEKNLVRERIISASVTALTTERASSPVVPADVFLKTLDYASRFLAEHGGTFVDDDLKPHVADWLALHASRVGTKKPSELQVLFLAGPDPTNDLMEFRKCGVAYENIWAIESDKDTFGLAVKALERQGIRVKLHRGNLHSFFSLVPQQFDIVYFDATAPLFGGEPNTIHVIRELVLNQRLTPLSVLVTNFAEANKDGKSAEVWGKRLGTWAYANGTMDTWTQNFPEFVDGHVMPQLPQVYGEFITKFLIRFCSQLVPWWRVVALPGAKREYFSNEKALDEAVHKADTAELLANGLYPLLRVVLFGSSYLNQQDAMWRLFFDEKLEGTKLAEAVKIASLIRTFYEKHFDDVHAVFSRFSPQDFPNVEELIEDLRSRSNPLAQYLWDRFSAEAQAMLTSRGGTAEQHQETLVRELNYVLEHGLIYEASRFNDVILSSGTVKLLSEALQGGDVVRLNRRLLEEAFPSKIRAGRYVGSKHVLQACSPDLARVLESFRWFDQGSRVFCDTPLPNLITDLLLGLYGFPYHANVQKLQRFAYKAKETVMFTDIMVLDKARYMYDLLPTLPLFDTDFSLSQQLVLRVCMDSLHRHCHYGCKDLFWGCALAGMGEEGFTFWLPPARESVGDPGVTFQEPDADGYETY